MSNSTRAAAHPIEVYVAGLLAVIDTDHGRMMPAHRNALPRQPLPGMVKLRCAACGYWFAAPAADVEKCPDCAIRLRWVQVEVVGAT